MFDIFDRHVNILPLDYKRSFNYFVLHSLYIKGKCWKVHGSCKPCPQICQKCQTFIYSFYIIQSLIKILRFFIRLIVIGQGQVISRIYNNNMHPGFTFILNFIKENNILIKDQYLWIKESSFSWIELLYAYMT